MNSLFSIVLFTTFSDTVQMKESTAAYLFNVHVEGHILITNDCNLPLVLLQAKEMSSREGICFTDKYYLI